MYGILASLFCLGFGILIGAMINANGEVLGSVAEWIGGFGTIAAVIAGFAQVKNQNKIKKANDIEEKRPRFDVKSASTIKNYKEIVALACKHDTQIVKKVLQDNGSKYSKIQIINISPNVVYNLAIKLTYTDSCGENVIDTYSYSGFSSNEQLFIIPNDYSSKIKLTNMIIKFLTSASELGFCEFSKGAKEEDMFEDAQYYFVNGNNSNVSGNEMGEMISREDTKFKKLDFKPSYMNNRFVIPPIKDVN